MTEMLISVIIPFYNRNALVQRAFQSVLKQTWHNLEILLIDDGSDEPFDVMVLPSDSRIRLIRLEENHGVSYARNRGIEQSSGEYIALLDSDDEWLPDKLEKQVTLMLKTGLRLVHGEEIWIRNGVRVNQGVRHRKEGGDIFIRSLDLCLISPSAALMKRELFTEYGLFNESMKVCEDYDMWLRITLHEEVGFIETPVLIKYGGHEDQLSRKYHSMDYYRVMSMLFLLRKGVSHPEKRSALAAKIAEKARILTKGALKREKHDEVREYEAIIREALSAE